MKHRKQSCEGGAHLAALHDRVEHPMREEKFRALKIRRKILTGGLFGHSAPGEADQRAGLGNVEIAQHRKGRGDAAGSRIA